ncbi:MAG: DUF3429 domain-containing protein [Acidisphaera sp.]|nr:DUF3429 domain-containing protein [Acidisphaera sp.]
MLLVRARDLTRAAPDWRELQGLALRTIGDVRDRGLANVVSLPSPRILVALAAMMPLLVSAVAAASVVIDSETLVERLMLAYAALMVSFLGALWALWVEEPRGETGRTLTPDGVAFAERKRLILGLAPAMIGGVALLSSLSNGLMLLILDFIALLALETATNHYGMPLAHHLRLRWGMVFAAVLILINVMSVRTYGVRIFF